MYNVIGQSKMRRNNMWWIRMNIRYFLVRENNHGLVEISYMLKLPCPWCVALIEFINVLLLWYLIPIRTVMRSVVGRCDMMRSGRGERGEEGHTTEDSNTSARLRPLFSSIPKFHFIVKYYFKRCKIHQTI